MTQDCLRLIPPLAYVQCAAQAISLGFNKVNLVSLLDSTIATGWKRSPMAILSFPGTFTLFSLSKVNSESVPSSHGACRKVKSDAESAC